MSINLLDVNPKVLEKLQRARINQVKKLLTYSPLELEKRTCISREQAQHVLQTAATLTLQATTFSNAYELSKRNDERLKTGCVGIDNCLNGGILYPGLTEVCGESASGKTQLCIQICLQNINTSAQALYICTEDPFPVKRLHQMASHFNNPNKLTDSLFIEHVSELDELWSLINEKLPLLLKSRNIKLVVIDSMAALFRSEFDAANMAERSRHLAKFGLCLHSLSHAHNMAVVCVNQVSDDFSAVCSINKEDGSKKVVPALGLTWSYMITTRVLLSRTEWSLSMFADKKVEHDSNIRSLKVLLAPHLPPSSSHFFVNEKGVCHFQRTIYD